MIIQTSISAKEKRNQNRVIFVFKFNSENFSYEVLSFMTITLLTKNIKTQLNCTLVISTSDFRLRFSFSVIENKIEA